MIVTTIKELKKSLKTYSKKQENEVVGLVWYRKKFFKDDLENKKFLTDDVFEDALDDVDDTLADEHISNQIISKLQELEEESKEELQELEEESKEELQELEEESKKETGEKKYKVTAYLVTCDIDDKNGWIEERVSYLFALEAKERAAEEGCSSLEKLGSMRKTLKELKASLIEDYGKEKGTEEFLSWKRENKIP